MILSDLSIRRPVFATVMSLLLVVLGVIAYTRLTLRELPAIDPPVVSVGVEYPGASAAVVETRDHADPRGRAVRHRGRRDDRVAEQQRRGQHQHRVLAVDRDIEAPRTTCATRSAASLDRLPDEADPPEIEKAESDSEVILWLNMRSTQHGHARADRLRATVTSSTACRRIDGVAQRAHRRRAALRDAGLARQRGARGARPHGHRRRGRRSSARTSSCRPGASSRPTATSRCACSAATGEPADFARTDARQGRGRLPGAARRRRAGRARLRRAPRVLPQQRRARTSASASSRPRRRTASTSRAPRARPRRRSRRRCPRACASSSRSTATVFIDAAIKRVFTTLVEAIALVIVVIYLFLGSARSALIPAVTIPVCLVDRVRRAVGVRLLDQPADAARDRAVHRPRRGRRDRRRRERPAPRRPRRAAARRCEAAARRRSRSRWSRRPPCWSRCSCRSGSWRAIPGGCSASSRSRSRARSRFPASSRSR